MLTFRPTSPKAITGAILLWGSALILFLFLFFVHLYVLNEGTTVLLVEAVLLLILLACTLFYPGFRFLLGLYFFRLAFFSSYMGGMMLTDFIVDIDHINGHYAKPMVVVGIVFFVLSFIISFSDHVVEYLFGIRANQFTKEWHQYDTKVFGLPAAQTASDSSEEAKQTLASQLYTDASFRKKYRHIRWFTLLVVALSFLVFVYLSINFLLPVLGYEPALAETAEPKNAFWEWLSGLGNLFLAFLMWFLFSTMAVLVFLLFAVFFFLPFLLSFPFSMPLIFKWKKPARILLFRPFHKQA